MTEIKINEDDLDKAVAVLDNRSLISPPLNTIVLLWIILLGLPGVLLFLILTKHAA